MSDVAEARCPQCGLWRGIDEVGLHGDQPCDDCLNDMPMAAIMAVARLRGHRRLESLKEDK